MKTLKEKLAENILYRMKCLGMNKTEVCQASGIGHAELSKMAGNPQRITVIFLLKICRGLQCGYSDLFEYNNKILPNIEIGSAYLQRIKARREEKEMAECNIARDLQMRTSTYKNFEAGVCGMDPKKFENLLYFLEITPDYLSGKTEPKPDSANGQTEEMTNLFTFERDEEYRKLENEVKSLRYKLAEALKIVDKASQLSAQLHELFGI